MVIGLEHLHKYGFIFGSRINSQTIFFDDFGNLQFFDWLRILFECEKMRSYLSYPNYMPPEVLKGEYRGIEEDFWLLGNFIFELLTGNVKNFSFFFHIFLTFFF